LQPSAVYNSTSGTRRSPLLPRQLALAACIPSAQIKVVAKPLNVGFMADRLRTE
jgi:hypothetical protein